MTEQQKIDTYFKTTWEFNEFFLGYCASKGIYDPYDTLTLYDFEKMWTETKERLTPERLTAMQEEMIAKTIDIIERTMGESYDGEF